MNISWLQANWAYILAALGGLHVILNIVGKMTGNKSIQGFDNLFLSILSSLGYKASDGTVTPPKA